jgi:hypothetical protein
MEAKTEALQSAELQGARLQAALTAAQSESQVARDGVLKIQEQLTLWVERATRAETKLEGVLREVQARSGQGSGAVKASLRDAPGYAPEQT